MIERRKLSSLILLSLFLLVIGCQQPSTLETTTEETVSEQIPLGYLMKETVSDQSRFCSYSDLVVVEVTIYQRCP